VRFRFRDHVRGRSVIDASGRVIGDVDDLVIDSDGWRVVALKLRLRRDAASAIGARPGPFRSAVLDVSADAVQSMTDTIVLKHDLKHLVPGSARAPEQHPQAPPSPH
jgi:sporulation protein YlmC with PRC-barrel domain